ncbi:uncharacterized protein LDX57_000266 [Aspergillus melleus]|uniref:uncharacterized protein n=1 Tax=Aspergillus melleus TaxID=138277 RepID=UPI001E8D7B21|nr:uncharacterized protein LDX57_000266 [Aspergillus melleus]KAH8422512.1 hypothetical protein LDX57_000266 [Aspergillus melleus]
MGHSTPTEDMEINDKLLPDEEARWRQEQKPQSNWERWGTILLVIATALVSLGIGALVGHQQQDSDKTCTLRVAQYSPVISNVGISYHQEQFNGSFLNENIYRKDAGPEVDAAWKSLGADYRSIRVPAEEAQRSGLAKDQVKISEKYGGGYPANVEGLHHLHCLNLLRQSLYYNYDYYHKQGHGAFKNDDFIVRRHVCKYHTTTSTLTSPDSSSPLSRHPPTAAHVHRRRRSSRSSLGSPRQPRAIRRLQHEASLP